MHKKIFTSEVKGAIAFGAGFSVTMSLVRLMDIAYFSFIITSIVTGFIFAFVNQDKLNKSYYYKAPLIMLLSVVAGGLLGASISFLSDAALTTIVGELSDFKLILQVDFAKLLGFAVILPLLIPNEARLTKQAFFGMLLVVFFVIMRYSDKVPFIEANYTYIYFVIYLAVGYLTGYKLKNIRKS
jgi:hypothetical protein